MSNKKRKRPMSPVEDAMRRQYIEKNATLMLSTAQTILPLVGYIVNKVECMVEGLDKNTSFSMTLRNKANHVVKECEDFINTFEPMIADNKKEGYGLMTDILYPSLDSWFDTLVKQKDVDATLEVRRRAKLRYHDPYPTDVKERTAAFEDGYEKGYMDCLKDLKRELARLENEEDGKGVVRILEGKVNIETIENEENHE